jgi:hypothetical protein
MVKLKWRVAPAPTGRYRSFDKRGFPSAEYPDGRPAAMLECEESYKATFARNGGHKPVAVCVADYSKGGGRFTWRKLLVEFASIDYAKEMAARAIARNGFAPKEYQ